MWWFLIPFLLGISGHTSSQEADRITDEYMSDEPYEGQIKEFNGVFEKYVNGVWIPVDDNLTSDSSSIIFDGKYLVYLSLVFGFWSGLNSNG